MAEGQIKVFGASWCPDTLRARRFLNQRKVPYEWHDIDRDDQARTYVMRVNGGKTTTPTILFPDESVLVEPSDEALAEKLGITS